MKKDVKTWETNESFIESKKKVESVKVVNDPAERAVKLTTDFAHAARGEAHFQNVIQVVESDR